MRTRFLTTDYFTTNQTLTFLRLPLSPLPSSYNHLSSFDDNHPFCTDDFAISVTYQLENLPIDDALSKFYSDVLPQTIDVQIPEKEADLCYEKKAAQSCLASDSETFENKFSWVRCKDAVGDQYEYEAAIVQFETPELTQHLESVHMPEKEEVQLFSEVQHCDDNLESVHILEKEAQLSSDGQHCDDKLEILNLVPVDPFGCDIMDHVSSVETMCLDYDMTLKSQMSDNVDFLPNGINISATVLPLLEVEVLGPSEFTRLCIEDECDSLFASIDEQLSVRSIDLGLCCQNLLVSKDIDILEHISDSHSSKLPLEFCFPILDLAPDLDLLQAIETHYMGLPGACPIPFSDTILFEEFMMLDSVSFDIFEVHAMCQTTDKIELCNMFEEDMPSKRFDELIVSGELAIIDGTFTSLSVPNLVDDEKVWSLNVIVDKLLTELEPVPLSTSDEIYLDWDLLGKDGCCGDVNAAIEVFNDVEDYTLGSSSNADDGSMLLFDFLLSDDPSAILDLRESKVTMPSGVSCKGELQREKAVSIEIPDEDCQIIENIRGLTNDDFEKLASGKLSEDDGQFTENGECDGDFHMLVPPVESLPQFDDLDFFLNPKKASGGIRTGHKINPQESNFMLSRGPHKTTAAPSSSIQMQRFDIQLHTIVLPANISILIDNFRRSYIELLRNVIQQSKTEFPVTISNDMNLLKLSEEKLLDQRSRSSQQKSFTGHVDDNYLDFVALCAIKRMTWCLCFYGVYSLHLFLCKLFQSLDSLKPRLSFLYSLIEDACQVVDKELTKSHPSLVTIKELLLQNDNRRGRVLILAQQIMWEPLKKLLTSIGLSFSEVDLSMHGNQPDLGCGFSVSGPRDHIQATCVLTPHEHVSPSILVQKFDMVVEYGGPCGFSKVSTHYREYIGSRTLHFMKVELDDVAKAMCEGVLVTGDERDTINLEALLNFGPVKDKSYKVSSEVSGGTNSCSMPIPTCQIAQESERDHPCDLSFQDMPIIINTQNFDKEMIISRRTTYQKILTMEKRGVQVVERDLILPVDVILNSTMCLMWYDSKNIATKAIAQDDGASSVPLCIENIAANVLTSLSFAFTTCILLFEGDSNFLGPVMESADELYAAAASLGTYLQIFYSSSFELTDEIILNYIGHSRNIYEGLLPRFPDSETLAESFLSKFPSLNPLSAHAIISSGSMLLEFFELTVEGRLHTFRKYHASDESVNLFTALCKYGEREESKSGVTDCSSSVSSPPDSGNFVCKINSGDRKRKFVASSCDADFRYSRPFQTYVDDGLTDQGMLRPSDSELSKGSRIFQKKLPDFLLDDELFCEGDAPDTTIIMNPSNTWCETDVTGVTKVPVMEDGFAQSTLHVNDRFSSQQKSGRTISNKREESAKNILQDLHEDFVSEIDFYDKSLFDGNFQLDEKTLKPSPVASENVKFHAPRYNRAARRLSFGNGSDQNMPMADAMDSCMLEDDRLLRADNEFDGVEYNWSTRSSNALERDEQKVKNTLEKSMQKFSSQFSKGMNVPLCGETPLSKAVHSGKLQQGSPWTIEFLNRIKEKRKLRQQCKPYASIPRSGDPGNTTKATKRRSPSILEYYKYQSDSTPRNVARQKRQKQHAQLSNERPSGFRPVCTPIDKRARRSLSFATNGTGSQTKLVWGDNVSCIQDSRFSS
ncbi:Protein SHORTAGE IN CHIASMATA 1 [Bienertia sinuspersici]